MQQNLYSFIKVAYKKFLEIIVNIQVHSASHYFADFILEMLSCKQFDSNIFINPYDKLDTKIL